LVEFNRECVPGWLAFTEEKAEGEGIGTNETK
jgi:hypothetical protein